MGDAEHAPAEPSLADASSPAQPAWRAAWERWRTAAGPWDLLASPVPFAGAAFHGEPPPSLAEAPAVPLAARNLAQAHLEAGCAVALDLPGHLSVAVAGTLASAGRCCAVLLLHNWANRAGRLFSPPLLASLVAYAPAPHTRRGLPPLFALEWERLHAPRAPAARLDDRYLLETEAFPAPGDLCKAGVGGMALLYRPPLQRDLREYRQALRAAGMAVWERRLILT